MRSLFGGVYEGIPVLVTGHTGFKGSWLAYWLTQLGARVTGYSLPAPSTPSHWSALNLDMQSVIGDVRDREFLQMAVDRCKPAIIFHLAAQPLVRDSYADPAGTYSTNVMGTLHVLDAARSCAAVRAVVAITTDKVYRNREWWWGYREADEVGGHDPYSSSKACAEILISSYRQSFFGAERPVLLASVRAGNVIGGGDWARDRLIPDVVRAAGAGQQLTIRNPYATRPWQHVLECLSGYLMTGQRLLEGKKEFADAFNFGPPESDALSVENVVNRIVKYWPEVRYAASPSEKNPHEARFLGLDCSKARAMLPWRPAWGIETALERTVGWYRRYYRDQAVSTPQDLDAYVDCARKGGLAWAA